MVDCERMCDHVFRLKIDCWCYLIAQMQVGIQCIGWKMQLWLRHHKVAPDVNVCVKWHCWSKFAITPPQLHVGSFHWWNAVITRGEFWEHVHDLTTGYPVPFDDLMTCESHTSMVSSMVKKNKNGILESKKASYLIGNAISYSHVGLKVH